jgi:hypothetical protein
MTTQGVFGYLIGKKKRMTHVSNDADLLWQILIREIYVLMNHFGSKEALKNAFEKIKTTKNKPKTEDIEKCKIFTDLEENTEEWSSQLKWCQSSYINMLESGYILNQKEEYGQIFMFDLNNFSVSYYGKNTIIKPDILATTTIEEIMEFEDMPKMSYKEIVYEMNERFKIWNEKYLKITEELEKLNNLKKEVKRQCAGNIEDKVDKLIYDMNFEKKQLNINRRVFYHRLKALDLIEEENVDKDLS